jgi:hypothetical protein
VRHRRDAVRSALALAALLVAPAAIAAPYAGIEPLDAWQGPLLGDARVIGLGGAFVGIGEGLGGTPSNPAAVAVRGRHLDRPWDVGASLTWFVPTSVQLSRLDLGNDGRPDSGFSGRGNLQLGISGQAGRLGAGILTQVAAVEVQRGGGDALQLATQRFSLSMGWSGLQDALVAGASVTVAYGSVVLLSSGVNTAQLEYRSTALRLGVLYCPRALPFRVGASFDPGARALAPATRATFPATSPPALLFPWIASVGASAWIGPNAARYNEPSPFALALHPEWGEGPPREEGVRDPVLVTAQLDVVGPTLGAVGIDGALAGGDALPSGRRASLVPRAGAEWEAINRWLRIRGGSYLEPSRTGAGPRAHATFGIEVRIPLWPWDLQLALTGDLAPLYQNTSMSLGFWSDLGPRPAPGA